MDQEQKVRSIYLKDLLFSLLYRWRALLAVAIALGLLLGGYKAVTQYRAGTQKTPTADNAAYHKEHDALELEISRLQARIDSQTAYLDESVLMTLDPYNVYVASMDIFVQSDYQILPSMSYQNPDRTVPILQTYCKNLSGVEVMNTVAQALNMDKIYLAELVTVTANNTSGIFTVSVLYSTEEGATDILERIYACVPALQDEITAAMGEHTLYTVYSESGLTVNTALTDQQKKATTQLTELEASLKTNQDALRALEAGHTPVSPKAAIRKGILFAIIGGILGGLIVACWVWVRHIASDKVYSARALQEATDVRILGCMAAPRGQRGPIARWLRRLEGRAPDKDETRPALVATSVYNHLGGAKKLLVIGDSDDKSRGLVCQTLTEAGIEALTRGSLLQDPEALAALPDCDAVLLVEKCGLSRYASVLQEIETVKDQKKPLLGCVLLEG